jgi:two-component system OmpR family response regulator
MMQAETGDAAAAWLDAGAADVVLAADPDALVAARLAALVRRHAGTIRVGDLVIDPAARRVWRDGREIRMLAREYAVLVQCARAAGRTVTRADLRRAVWGVEHDPGTNVIEVHVSRLRARLHHGFAAPILFTERGVGYRLGPPVVGEEQSP